MRADRFDQEHAPGAMRVSARASSLPAVQQCARRAATQRLTAAQRVEFGVRQLDRHVGAAVGSGTHAGAAHLNQEFATTGELGSNGRLRDAVDAGIEILRTEAADGLMTDDVTPSLNAAEQTVARMLPIYRASVDPEIQPVLVEAGLEMRIGDSLVITGHVDLFLADGVPEDLKTGAHEPRAWAQYGAYSLLLRANGYRVAGGFRERYIRRVRADKPMLEPRVREYPQGALEHEALATARAIARDVEEFECTGDPGSFPANPSSWLCSDRLCPAWGSKWCSAWRLKTGE